MTIIMPDSLSPLEQMRWLPWRNDSSETCPAGGLVRVTGSTLKGRLLVRTGNKPNADSQAGLYVNSQFPVAAGGYGRITRESPCIAAYASGTPANGEVWGAASASWYLTSGKRGWLVDGAANATRSIVPVQRVPGDVSSGSASSSSPVIPCYAVRNSSGQIFSYATTTTVTLDTQIHKYPDDTSVFELSSSEVTIKQSGLYRFCWGIPLRPVSSSGNGAAWLEEGGSQIPGASATFQWPVNSTNTTATFVNSVDHVVDVSGGNKTYRLRIWASPVSSEISGSDVSSGDGGYARLDIHKIRDA